VNDNGPFSETVFETPTMLPSDPYAVIAPFTMSKTSAVIDSELMDSVVCIIHAASKRASQRKGCENTAIHQLELSANCFRTGVSSVSPAKSENFVASEEPGSGPAEQNDPAVWRPRGVATERVARIGMRAAKANMMLSRPWLCQSNGGK
jgi:hypothetical protein